jgi:hypothetical protein
VDGSRAVPRSGEAWGRGGVGPARGSGGMAWLAVARPWHMHEQRATGIETGEGGG